MKYVFFGTPRFASVVLERLIAAGMPPAALVSNPDRPTGRKKIITPPPAKLAAQAHPSIKVFQPEELDDAFANQLRELDADCFIVAAYAKIIPQNVLDVPRLGTIGVHPSLLPKYRGAAPIQSAILNGETETGVTLYLMDEKMDHGPVLAQKTCAIGENETYAAFHEKLAALSAEMLIATMPDLAAGKATPRAQDEAQATYTKKFTAADGFIEYAEIEAAQRGEGGSGNGAPAKTRAILRKIKALNPEPGVWTMRDGKRLKLLEAEVRNDALRLVTIQEEGQTPKRVG